MYDLIIIGAGPGGMACALRAAKYGASVLLFEKENIGGVCLNWGCIPTKAMLKNAEVYNYVQASDHYGIDSSGITVNYAEMKNRKVSIVDNLRSGAERNLKAKKIDVIKSEAAVVSTGKVKYCDADGQMKEVEGKHIVLATGSSARELPGIRIDEDRVLSSKGLLALKDLPASLMIIGGGVIGCEFAYLYSTLGVDVSVIELEKNVLPGFSADIRKRLQTSLKKAGVNFYCGQKLDSLRADRHGVCAVLDSGAELNAEYALLSVGRAINIENLFSEGLNVDIENNRVKTDEYGMTSVPNIYAIGDLIASLQLAHTASFEGEVIADNLFSKSKKSIIRKNVPSCVYTVPEIASVGVSMDKAKEDDSVAIARFMTGANGMIHCSGRAGGFLRLTYEKETGVVLGGESFGPASSDLICEIALAVENKLTVSDIEKTIHPHPSFGESVREAAVEASFEVKAKV